MDKLPVGQLPDLQQSNNDDEIMVITNSEYNQLKKEKISDLITDFTSTNENNALTKGTDGKMFVTDFGNASNITEGTLPTSVLPEIPLEKIPDIPKDKLPAIETSDLPVSGVTADTYAYPSSVTVNAQGQVTAIEEGSPSGANANTDLSNLTEEGEKHFLNKTQITNCILSAPNGVATFSGSNITLKQGLKMLYPNGRNIDKTLKNGELTLDYDTIIDLSSHSGQTFDFELLFGCNINYSYISQNYQESDVAPTTFTGTNQIYLNTTENQMYFYNSSASLWEEKTFIKLGKGKLENGVVTSFTPYQPVELLKRSDLEGKLNADHSNDTKPYITETYVNGTSGYRVWSDGYCEQWGRTVSGTVGTVTVNLFKTMKNTAYTCQITLFGNTSGYGNAVTGSYFTCWNLTTTSFQHQRTSDERIQQMWKVSGYLAEGQY